MSAQSPDRSVKCDKCGMTFVSDGAMAMHHPCSFAPPGSAQSALDAVRAALENCPACGGRGWFTTTGIGCGAPDSSGEPTPVPVEEQRQCECSAITGPVRAALPVIEAALLHAEQEREQNLRMREWFFEMTGIDGTLAEQKAALRAEVERLTVTLSTMTQAVGLATTCVPAMVMDPDDPIGMMQRVCAEVERLKDCAEWTLARNLESAAAQRERDMALVHERDAARAELAQAVSVPEEHRQSILLALAEMSLSRPGILQHLRETSKLFSGEKLFDAFRETSGKVTLARYRGAP